MPSIVLGRKPSSQDLRDRLITALAAGTATQRVIAERFGVSGSLTCVTALVADQAFTWPSPAIARHSLWPPLRPWRVPNVLKQLALRDV
jgi:hypothetical protein